MATGPDETMRLATRVAYAHLDAVFVFRCSLVSAQDFASTARAAQMALPAFQRALLALAAALLLVAAAPWPEAAERAAARLFGGAGSNESIGAQRGGGCPAGFRSGPLPAHHPPVPGLGASALESEGDTLSADHEQTGGETSKAQVEL